MHLIDYYFELPNDLIAQEPLADRAASRMLVIDRARREFRDERFATLPRMLKKSDLLVLNNTRVFPARLLGRTESGSNVEIFLVEKSRPGTWLALGKPGRRLKPGKRIEFDGRFYAEIIEKTDGGKVIVRFGPEDLSDSAVDDIGRTPIPPYIARDPVRPDIDRERYQTVFASRRGAIAAPTAGLHFTNSIFEKLSERSIDVAEITLHVGYGTFEPVRTAELIAHRVAPERFEIGELAAEKLEKARREGRRIVAVGTTTTRTLEYVLTAHGSFQAISGRADLTIIPGYGFKAIGALLTNFHLPESSLLILVATFGGHQLIMDAYRHAVVSQYRFYSYGDCMFIE